MKKLLLLAVTLLLSLAACTAAPITTVSLPPAIAASPFATQSVSPAVTASPSMAATPQLAPTASPSSPQSVLPDEDETEPTATKSMPPAGFPDGLGAGGYVPDSDSNLFEDEDYFVLRNDNGIFVFDKNTNEILAILPCTEAFTYCNKKVYYISYDVDTKKRNIIEHSVPSGEERIIIQEYNKVVSMLAYGGQLYYAYQSDPGNATETALGIVALNGSNTPVFDAQYIYHFVIKGGSLYYTDLSTSSDSNRPSLYKLSLKDGRKVKIPVNIIWTNDLEMIGDTLIFPTKIDSEDDSDDSEDDSDYPEDGYDDPEGDYEVSESDFYNIGFYNTKTGSTSSFTPDAKDWDGWYSDFTFLGRYLIFAVPSGHVRAYDLNSGEINDLADSGQESIEKYTLYTANGGVYISPQKHDGTTQLYKADFSGGKASLKEIFNYAPPGKTP